MTDAGRRTTNTGGYLARLLSAVGALATAIAEPAAAQRVPVLDITPSCRHASERAAPIGSVENCLKLEQEARDRLIKQWATYAPADKSHCMELSTLGGEPTYTELLTCLEIARDARNATDRKDRGTTGQGGR